MCVDDQASLFTGVLFGPLYGPPPGFRFEGFDPPIMVSYLLSGFENQLLVSK